MAEFRTDYFTQGPAVKLDPAGAMQSAVTLANGMTQNRLLQGAVQLQQPAIDTAKLKLAQEQVGGLRSSLGTLLSNPNPTSAHLQELGQTGLAQGWFTPQQLQAEMASWPGDNAPAAARKAWVQSHYVRQLTNEQQISTMLGSPGTVNTGDQTKIVYSSPLNGTHESAGGSFAHELGPTDRISPQQQYVHGQPGSVPVGSRYDNRGYVRGAPQGDVNPITGLPTAPEPSAGAASNMAPRSLTMAPDPTSSRKGGPTTAPGDTGDQRLAALPDHMKPAPGAAPGTPPGWVPTGANPAATGSIDLLNKDRAAAANYNADVTPLQTAIAGLDKLGPTGTGPATEKLNDLKSLAISLNIPGASAWTDNVKAYDETRKYLMQNATRGGTGTNDQLAAAIAGNPSVGISNAAASDIAKTSLALRRMQHAGYLKNQVAGQEGSYADRTAQWNASQDPRAFALDLMKPEAKAALLKSLGSPDSPAYKKFKQSLEDAHAAGIYGGAR